MVPMQGLAMAWDGKMQLDSSQPTLFRAACSCRWQKCIILCADAYCCNETSSVLARMLLTGGKASISNVHSTVETEDILSSFHTGMLIDKGGLDCHSHSHCTGTDHLGALVCVDRRLL